MTRRLKQVAIQAPDRSPPLVTLASRDPQTDALRHNDSSDARAALSELLRKRPSEVGADLAHRAETFREWLDRGLLGAAEFLEPPRATPPERLAQVPQPLALPPLAQAKDRGEGGAYALSTTFALVRPYYPMLVRLYLPWTLPAAYNRRMTSLCSYGWVTR